MRTTEVVRQQARHRLGGVPAGGRRPEPRAIRVDRVIEALRALPGERADTRAARTRSRPAPRA